jgi:hypothetical protein
MNDGNFMGMRLVIRFRLPIQTFFRRIVPGQRPKTFRNGAASLTLTMAISKFARMKGASASAKRWVLFCRSRALRGGEEVTFVSGTKRIEAEFSVQSEGAYDLIVRGELLGAKLAWEARSRRRLPGDEEHSVTPLFQGTFNHAGGVSGDFVVRPKRDGELMTLGFYGAPPAVQLIKFNPIYVASPVEVRGLPGTEVSFEDPTEYQVSITKSGLQAAVGKKLWRYYAGYCVGASESDENLPPMPGVLVTMLLAYQLLLKPYYLTNSPS